jgi:hypothetical protein
MRAPRLLASAIAACLVAAVPASAGLFDPRLEIWKYDREVAPGDSITIDGFHWFSLISPNCDGSVHVKLRDAEDKNWSLGTLGGQTGLELLVDYEGEAVGDMTGRLKIPNGVAPGPAKITAKQRLRLKIFPLSCSQIQLATKSATARITILGAVGNSPPQITGLAAPTIRQGVATPITWTASEAGTTTIALEYQFVEGRWIDLGQLGNVATVAGANAFSWNATLDGHYLPAGTYRVTLEQAGDVGELSAPARTTFQVAYG